MELNEAEHDIMSSLGAAYMEDPSPECGRTYCKGEDEFTTAKKLMKRGLVRKVDDGKFEECGTPYIHFGLTDAGFKIVSEMYS